MHDGEATPEKTLKKISLLSVAPYSFTINLTYGQLEGCDTAFHFQPQWEPSPAVVFNSFKNGEWETEEKIDAMPFTKGQDYELYIFVTSKGYQVRKISNIFQKML